MVSALRQRDALQPVSADIDREMAFHMAERTDELWRVG